MPPETATRRTGCLRSFFIGVGCGCVYPVAMLIVFVVLGWFFLAEPLQLVFTQEKLPEFAGPEQEDFWNLQEKRLDLESTASASLVLRPSEFNAYLNAWQIPPVSGFCLQRARFVAGEQRGIFYLIGSGYMLRSLVIQIEIAKTSGGIKPGLITINSWPVPADGFIRNQVEKFIKSILEADPKGLPVAYLSGAATFDFNEAEITLSGKY